MRVVMTIETSNELVNLYCWLLGRIKEVEHYHNEKNLPDSYGDALLDVKKMCIREEPLLKLVQNNPKE